MSENPHASLLPLLHGIDIVQHAKDDPACAQSYYVLRSGAHSPYYIDMRKTVSHPRVCNAIADALHKEYHNVCAHVRSTVPELLHADAPVYVCGLPLGAVPYASVLSARHNVPQVLLRKTPKAHGRGQMVEGDCVRGARVVLVEDVVTSGQSVHDAIATLRTCGHVVVGVVCVLYRGDSKHVPTFRNDANDTWHIPFRALFDVDEWIKGTTTEEDTTQQEQQPSKGARIRDVMQRQHSNVCVAIDKCTTAEVRAIIETVGAHVCIVKLHADIINDFDEAFIAYLLRAKRTHGFLLWEDRKFADIGHTVRRQLHGGVHRISSWADIVSCHAVAGRPALDALTGVSETEAPSDVPMVVLVASLSCADNLLDETYTQRAISVARNHPHVVGVVTQKALSASDAAALLTFVPGITLRADASASDAFGQQYHTMDDKPFADVLVVGRAITNAPTPAQMLQRVRALVTTTRPPDAPHTSHSATTC